MFFWGGSKGTMIISGDIPSKEITRKGEGGRMSTPLGDGLLLGLLFVSLEVLGQGASVVFFWSSGLPEV